MSDKRQMITKNTDEKHDWEESCSRRGCKPVEPLTVEELMTPTRGGAETHPHPDPELPGAGPRCQLCGGEMELVGTKNKGGMRLEVWFACRNDGRAVVFTNDGSEQQQ